MNRTIRNAAMAIGLIGGAVLMTAPATANSVHEEGNFGGTWTKIEPSDYYGYRRHAGRVGPLYSGRYYSRYYYPRGYAYYGPSRYYDPYYYGPGYYARPGVSFGIGFY